MDKFFSENPLFLPCSGSCAGSTGFWGWGVCGREVGDGCDAGWEDGSADGGKGDGAPGHSLGNFKKSVWTNFASDFFLASNFPFWKI